MHDRKKLRGHTLVELCFCVVVLAILATLAVPGFRSALRNSAVRSALFELNSGLHATRNSSIVEARPGVLCLSDALGNCLPGLDSSNAWSAYLDVEGRLQPLAGNALPEGLFLRATRPRLSFWPDARAASPATLTICDAQGVARPRSVVLSQAGRIRITDASDADCRT
jgi:type IV fimbrial biogenesis protein FimT